MKTDLGKHCFDVKETMGPQSQACLLLEGHTTPSRTKITRECQFFFRSFDRALARRLLRGGPDHGRYEVLLISDIYLNYTRTSYHLPRKIQMKARHTCQAMFQSAGILRRVCIDIRTNAQLASGRKGEAY